MSGPFHSIHHVQLAMPAGREEEARAFYAGVLGMKEVPKPEKFAKRGGCWFESGGVQIHLGVEAEFRPAKKAHPALRCNDYSEFIRRLRHHGFQVNEADDIPGVRRCHIHDPFGNRIELMDSPSIRENPLVLVLASASPRRQELLRNARVPFVAQPTDIPEFPKPGEEPRAYAERLAREKALAIFSRKPGEVVLGADTVVVVDGQILEKPRDAGDAARMLRMLSGREHQVITGVCIVGFPQGLKPSAGVRVQGRAKAVPFHETAEDRFEDVRSAMTRVTFSMLTEDDIRDYVATDEPMDKAGAYAIQGIASRWITRIEGDYFNVVGLPVALVCRMLREHGIKAG